MFSARRRISPTKLYNKDFLETLSKDLVSAGFSELTIKLPHNIVGMDNCEISLDDFLKRERNYPSLILIARSPQRNETIKILFVNISKKAFFVDDTFPSGHSEPPELFVQSPDPARVYSLTGFFGAYFDKKGEKTKPAMQIIQYFVAIFALMAELLSLLPQGKGFLTLTHPTSNLMGLIDFIIIVGSLAIIFTSSKTPTGLYVNPPPKRGLSTLANKALKGQLMDNPLVSLIVTVIAGILTAIILHLLNLP